MSACQLPVLAPAPRLPALRSQAQDPQASTRLDKARRCHGSSRLSASPGPDDARPASFHCASLCVALRRFASLPDHRPAPHHSHSHCHSHCCHSLTDPATRQDEVALMFSMVGGLCVRNSVSPTQGYAGCERRTSYIAISHECLASGLAPASAALQALPRPPEVQRQNAAISNFLRSSRSRVAEMAGASASLGMCSVLVQKVAGRCCW